MTWRCGSQYSNQELTLMVASSNTIKSQSTINELPANNTHNWLIMDNETNVSITF